MTVSVWEQAHSLLGALLLGVATGLTYDLLRCIRYRIRSRIFCGVLDLLFWAAVTAALFLWSVAAGRGVVQVSVCVFLFLGGVVYFRFLSPLFFPVLSWLTNSAVKFFRLLLAPFRWVLGTAAKIGKKFILFFKNHFSFPGK